MCARCAQSYWNPLQLSWSVRLRTGRGGHVRTSYVHYGVADLHFEWDPAKARANLRKHGISFDEAETAFADEYALVLPDPDHSSTDDERLVLIGLSAALRVLVVIHCELEDGNVIRLISARRATRSERAQYDARWKR